VISKHLGKRKFCPCSVVVYILNKFTKVEKLYQTAYCGHICGNEISDALEIKFGIRILDFE
jgi:hypothetical protein